MSITDNDQLVQDLAKGRITRWEFMTRGLALGLSASAVATLIAKYSGPTPALAATDSAQKFSGKLVIFTIQNPPPQAQDALNKAYKVHQPNVTIVWDTKTIQPAQYVPILGTELAAGDTAPDIVSANYEATFRGYVNLDEYKASINPYTGHPWSKDINWGFFNGTNAQGQQIILATQAVHINWFYNKDMFAKAKVEPPTTWTEFVNVCAQLQKVGLTPVVSNYDYMVPQWFAEIYFDQYHINWVNTVRAQPDDWNYEPPLDGKFKFNPNDPNIHNEYTYNVQRFLKGVRDGVLRFDTPQMEEIVTNMAAIFPKYATKDFFVVEDPYPIFLQQGAAIMSDGSWSLPTLTNDLASLSPARLKTLGIKPGTVKTFNWGTFENPAMQSKLVTSRVRSVESASGEYVGVVNKNQSQTNMAIDFLMFWMSKAGYQPYLNGYAQSNEFDPSGPLEINGVSYPPALQKLFSRLKFLGNAEASYNGEWTSYGGGDLLRDLHGLLQNALQGTITPKQYAQQLQSYLTKNLAASVKLRGLTMADIDNPSRQPGT